MVDQSLGGCNTVIEPKTRRRYKKHNFVSLELSSKAELFINGSLNVAAPSNSSFEISRISKLSRGKPVIALAFARAVTGL